jgi:hypothetical protein
MGFGSAQGDAGGGGALTPDSVTSSHIVNSTIVQADVANGYVDLSSAQTVSGIKTFQIPRSAGNPTSPTDLANKAYVDAASLADNSVGTNHLKIPSVSGSVIAISSILNGHLSTNLIDVSNLRIPSVSGSVIATPGIGTGHLANNIITNAHLQSAIISGNVIGTGAVLNGHLASGPAATSSIVGTADTQTLTNKRITVRVVTVSDAISLTPNIDTSDVVLQVNTQVASGLTINAPVGTPTDDQRFVLRVKSTNPQTYVFNSIYRNGTDVLLPAITTSGRTDRLGFAYNLADTKWDFAGLSRGH